MATKKKELLEQDAPVTETVMSEGETLLADTAQPESLPADAGDGLDLNELLGQMDQPQEDTSAEDMELKIPFLNLARRKCSGMRLLKQTIKALLPLICRKTLMCSRLMFTKITPTLCRNPLHLQSPSVPAGRRKKLLLLKNLSQRKFLPKQQCRRIQTETLSIAEEPAVEPDVPAVEEVAAPAPIPSPPHVSPAPSAARLPSLPSATGMMSRLPKTEMM